MRSLTMLAGPPRQPIAVPPTVVRLAEGDLVRAVWENQVGGYTFEVGKEAGRRLVKWSPSTSGINLRDEAPRLMWAERYTPVPRVVEFGGDETETWLVTLPLRGETAVSERWKQDPRRVVTAIGVGLRALHDALPVEGCPFTWSAERRFATAVSRAVSNQFNPASWSEVHRHLTIEGALDLLQEAPPIDQLVVCHGDACAPNTLVLDDGQWSGHVDLGSMGIADRWADLAVATWSTGWNYGPGYEELLLDAYGVSPDPRRTAFYRLLWDLSS
jgi:aminoglycoside phosphotransferase